MIKSLENLYPNASIKFKIDENEMKEKEGKSFFKMIPFLVKFEDSYHNQMLPQNENSKQLKIWSDCGRVMFAVWGSSYYPQSEKYEEGFNFCYYLLIYIF